MKKNIVQILTEETTFKRLRIGDVIVTPKTVWSNRKMFRYEFLKVIDKGTSWVGEYNYISFDNKQYVKEEDASDIYDVVVGR